MRGDEVLACFLRQESSIGLDLFDALFNCFKGNNRKTMREVHHRSTTISLTLGGSNQHGW